MIKASVTCALADKEIERAWFLSSARCASSPCGVTTLFMPPRVPGARADGRRLV